MSRLHVAAAAALLAGLAVAGGCGGGSAVVVRPPSTSAGPASTSAGPSSTTYRPSSTTLPVTSLPVTTTSLPVTTTSVPVASTSVPVTTTSLPVAPTSTRPASTSSTSPPPTSAAARQQLTLQPSSGLRSGQQIELRASGFSPGQNLIVIECANKKEATGMGDCNLAGALNVVSDAAGEVSTTFTVERGPFGGNGVVCAEPRSCIVSVSQAVPAPTEQAGAPISFG